MTDYERGVEQASNIYKEVIREYVAENAKLRELCGDMCDLLPHADWPSTECDEKASACIDQASELGIVVDYDKD